MERSINLQSATIGEIARFNSNAIQVFKKYGIDFYCKGINLLKEACATSQCDERIVLTDLQTVISTEVNEDQDFNSWSLEKLITHIINSHHQYVNIHVPEVSALLRSVWDGKEVHDFDFKRIIELFRQLGNDMKQHMQKEELALFPYIRKLEAGEDLPAGSSVKSLITVVEFEHDTSAIIIKQINRLCNDFSVPDGVSQLFCSLFDKLSEFEADLIMHIHVENNVLHKKAAELEQMLMVSQN